MADNQTTRGGALWTVDDLATHLGLSRRTLYRWRAEGTGPRVLKIGTALRYRPEDVQTWLDQTAEPLILTKGVVPKPARTTQALDDAFWRSA